MSLHLRALPEPLQTVLQTPWVGPQRQPWLTSSPWLAPPTLLLLLYDLDISISSQLHTRLRCEGAVPTCCSSWLDLGQLQLLVGAAKASAVNGRLPRLAASFGML